ncbi:MAG: hypothetical protein Q9195_000744 [Heterodermia aff. obscurata]
MALAKPDIKRTALIVVDMQEDFCPPIATKDWHPSDHVSFDTSHPSPDIKPFVSKTTIHNPDDVSESLEISIWPVHCVQGTKGAEIISEIDVSKLDHIVEKGRDKRVEMFSAFATCFGSISNAASHDLGDLLRQANITNVFVTGLAGDYCVRCTAMDANKENFKVYVIDEAVKSIDSGETGWGAVRAEMVHRGIHIVSMKGPEMSGFWTGQN